MSGSEETDTYTHEESSPNGYTAQLAGEIEAKWQAYWDTNGSFNAPNPEGTLSSGDPLPVDHTYVLDMFPYPSGAGLHVGHPLGFIATDIYARYFRTRGHNVLYTMGYDSFGLPAEQYAVQTGTHPRVTTDANIARYRQQLRRIGMSYDDRHTLSTTDPEYYRWTQWIFLQLYNSWYDTTANTARPISELEQQFEQGKRVLDGDSLWADLDNVGRDNVLSAYRLAYLSDAPVNWAPGLGTVLANEEVTADRRSERGNYPVFKSKLKQWKLRITAFADRLLDDLDQVHWPDAVKAQQRNWIGKSTGALVEFSIVEDVELVLSAFTTRPDTLFGVSYIAVAADHPLVESLVTSESARSEIAALRLSQTSHEENAEPSSAGIFTGSHARHPVTGETLPVYVAGYVLAEYGTGAVMGVPAHDQRDFDFAATNDLPIRVVIEPDDGSVGGEQTELPFVSRHGHAVNSSSDAISLDGLSVDAAAERIVDWMEANNAGRREVSYRLRDWLFSRQRYWGEPFPIVYDEDGVAHALPDEMLPVLLPEVDDYSPRTFDPDDADSSPETPLSRNEDWVSVVLDLGDGPKPYRRETNTMPNWAGSSWYELRYIDPSNSEGAVSPANESYWMGPTGDKRMGGVDLYVGGTEQAVLHLLYARFWHKVLFDLGWLSSAEPFDRLFNQGMIQAFVYRDHRGIAVPADEVVQEGDTYLFEGQPVSRQLGKMGKSLKNAVAPDFISDQYGADTLRIYEMSTGPLDASRPWDSRAVVGAQRFLQRVWRNVVGPDGTLVVTDDDAPEDVVRRLHQTLAEFHSAIPSLRFNTVIARLIELNNELTRRTISPRSIIEPMVQMIAPFAPHVAEELWHRMGHDESLTRLAVPSADPALLTSSVATAVVQVNGKVRSRLEVATDVTAEDLEAFALRDGRVQQLLSGLTVVRVISRPPTLINIVAR